MKVARLITGISVLLFIFISCSKGGDDNNNPPPPPPPPPGDVCANIAKAFAANASPLFQTYCNQSGCHNAGSSNGPGPLTNYTQIFNARTAIRAAVQSGIMPKNTTLTAAQKNTIICWIDSGAPNN
jgi:hypothetical protein